MSFTGASFWSSLTTTTKKLNRNQQFQTPHGSPTPTGGVERPRAKKNRGTKRPVKKERVAEDQVWKNAAKITTNTMWFVELLCEICAKMFAHVVELSLHLTLQLNYILKHIKIIKLARTGSTWCFLLLKFSLSESESLEKKTYLQGILSRFRFGSRLTHQIKVDVSFNLKLFRSKNPTSWAQGADQNRSNIYMEEPWHGAFSRSSPL